MSSIIDSDVLGLFSARAQELLSKATRRYAPKDRETIQRKLTACKRPAYEAVVEFEQFFGGLVIGPQREKVELGVSFSESDPDPDDPDDPERTMVPIGQMPSSPILLFMDERGEVVSYFERIWARSSSIFSYIEQLALGVEDRWPTPRFSVAIRPPSGDRLAESLCLQRIDAACDDYETWWEDDKLSLQQVRFDGSWQSKATYAYGRTLRNIVEVIKEASRLNPELRVNINSEPFVEAKWTKKQQRAAPENADSWDRTPGALRLRYGQQEEDIAGTVWIMEQGGEIKVHQFRMDRGKLIGWDTYTEKGGICRDAE